MADRIRGITIEIGGDTTKLQSALKDVNSSIKDTQNSLKDVEKLLKLDPKNTELLTQKHEMLAKQVENTKEKLQTLKTAQEQMKASGVDKSSEQYQALEREIIDCEQALKRLEKASIESNVSLQKVAETGKSFKKVGDGITNVGKEVSKASVAVATGMGVAVKTTMDFDSQMSKVRAISGATAEEFDLLRDKAREMGSKTKFSATESAQAFEYMAMAGWNTEDMLNGIEGVMNLASASGEDLATTSDILTDAMTALNIEITKENVTHFADILATASSNSNTNVAMMGETFKYVAPLFGSMGYSAEDCAIAIGLMANSGIKATQSGTALRGIITRLAKPTKESAEAMKVLGISLDDGEGNMYSFMDIMKQMREGFGELKISEQELNQEMSTLDSQLEDGTITQKEYDESVSDLMKRAYGAEGALKAEASAMLAGKNALSGLLAIVNASDEDFNKLTQAVANADGTAQEMSDIMQDNLGGQLTILKSQLEELAISFGDLLVPKLREFVSHIQDMVDKFNGLDEWQKKLILGIGLVIVVLGPLLVIIGSLISSIGQMMIFLPMIVSTIAPVVGAIGAFITANLGIIAVIGLVIVAIVTVIKHWDDIKEAVRLACEIIGEWIDNLKNKFADWVENAKQIFEIFKVAWDLLWDGMKSKAENMWEGIKAVFRLGWEYIKGLFKQKLEFPKIKMPHFSIDGKLSLNPPSVPKIKVDWYKKAYDDAYLLNSPTIFGASGGKLLGGGEGNGSEAVVGTDKLMSMMSDVVGNQNVTVVLEGDAQGVFNLVRVENNRFMKSNGYSPLMG